VEIHLYGLEYRQCFVSGDTLIRYGNNTSQGISIGISHHNFKVNERTF